jgi:hypothetical protein
VKKSFIWLVLTIMNINAVVAGQADQMYIRGELYDKIGFYQAINDEKPIGHISGQTLVNRLKEEKDWSKILIEGWVKYKYVDETLTKDQYKFNCEQSVLSKANSFFGLSVADFEKGAIARRLEDKEGSWIKLQKEVWVKSKTLSTTPTKPIELVSWEWTDSVNSIMITGIVKNNTGKTHHLLTLQIEAKDGNGNFLGSGSGVIGRQVFNPKESASFTVFIDGARSETNSIQIDYKWTSVETDKISEKLQ